MRESIIVKEDVSNENGSSRTSSTASSIMTELSSSDITSTSITASTTTPTSNPSAKLQQRFASTMLARNQAFGRDMEIAHIKDVYEKVKSGTKSSHVVFISGITGCGKTNLARSIQHQVEVVDQSLYGGYYITGKYDQLQRPEPHSAIVAAFTDLIVQMKDRNTIHDLHAAFVRHGIDYDHDGKDLIEMIPILQSVILPKQKVVVESTTEISATEMNNSIDQSTNNNSVNETEEYNILSNTDSVCDNCRRFQYGGSSGLSTNRWKDLLRLFVRSVLSMEKIIVCLIEDLHWADESSIDVLQSLFEDKVNKGTMFFCTYRKGGDDTVRKGTSPSSLDRLKKDLQQYDVDLTHFELGTISSIAITALLSDCLSVSQLTVEPLALLISNWSKGNAILVWKYIHFLYLKELLNINPTTGQFEWDMEEIQMEAQAIKDLLQYKMGMLTAPSLESLKMVACLGSKLDEEILFLLFSKNKEAVNSFIDEIQKINFIRYDESFGAWYFSHDFVQEKIYNSIPINERQVYHYRIGRKLWREFDIDELGQFLSLVVGQLLLGCACIKDHREKVAVAKLCLGAGVRAFQRSNFQSSYHYLQSGISLLGDEMWEEEYDLMLNLHNAAAEVANCLGKFADVNLLVHICLTRSRTFEDSLRARSTKVQALGRCGKLREAINSALDVLSYLGEKFSLKQSPLRILAELSYTRWRLRNKTNEKILRLPLMADPKKLATMEFMNLIPVYSALVYPELAPLLFCRMVHVSLDHGLSAVSCVGFVGFAALVSGIAQSFAEADRLGKLGFQLMKKLNAKPWLARISDIYYDLVHGWVHPFFSCREPLLYAYNVGLQTGDTEFAIACAMSPIFLEFDMRPLYDLECMMSKLLERIELYGLKTLANLVEPLRHIIEFLLETFDGDINKLKKQIVNDDCLYSDDSFHLLNAWKYAHRAFNFYVFECIEEAYDSAKNIDKLVVTFYGPCRCSFVATLSGLIDVAYARHMKQKYAPKAKKYSKLLLRWATRGEPRNFLGKHYLLEAELAALAGNQSRAYQFYISAIGACREGKFLLNTAIATERVAKSLLQWGKNELATPYFQEAISLYTEWGAIGKVGLLKQEIQQLGLEMQDM